MFREYNKNDTIIQFYSNASNSHYMLSNFHWIKDGIKDDN